jgi:hypothetical protein
MAQSGHRDGAEECPLLGVKRTSQIRPVNRRIEALGTEVRFRDGFPHLNHHARYDIVGTAP